MPIKSRMLRSATAALLLATGAAGADGKAYYEVTITNLTRGQTFTPILVVSHRSGVRLFEAGRGAGDELSAPAEGGDVDPLTVMLKANRRVSDVKNSGGLLDPGESVTVGVSARHGARHISLASMLIHTNDGFIGLDGARAPRNKGTVMYVSPAYDAGTEPNDESCDNIPGPFCDGVGGSPGEGGEGYVHVHGGIHGTGDLEAAEYDWRNPVARITIRRRD